MWSHQFCTLTGFSSRNNMCIGACILCVREKLKKCYKIHRLQGGRPTWSITLRWWNSCGTGSRPWSRVMAVMSCDCSRLASIMRSTARQSPWVAMTRTALSFCRGTNSLSALITSMTPAVELGLAWMMPMFACHVTSLTINNRATVLVWYGILEFNVPLDTV